MKNLFGLTVIVLVMILSVSVIMGDDWSPFVAEVRQTLKDQVESVVSGLELKQRRAEEQVIAARKKVARIPALVVETRGRINRIERNVMLARAERQNTRSELAVIRRRVEEDLPVRLVSGRELTPPATRLRIEHAEQKLGLVDQKIAVHEGFLEKLRDRLARLTEMRGRAHVELARLDMSVRFLGEKIAWQKEQLKLFSEDGETEEVLVGIFDRARGTLEDAHMSIDGKLAELDAMISFPLEEAIATGANGDSSETLTAEIDRILSDVKLAYGDAERLASQ